MREIIVTPCDKNFAFIAVKTKGEKLNIDNLPIVKALKTPNKHLFVQSVKQKSNIKRHINLVQA